MRDKENESLIFKIKLAHEKSRRIYGSPRITAELHASGIRCGKDRIARLM
ncbi:MAG: transposase, partial [Syntrophobacterales bacterium]|nr:transposase [Syntrophobacterales bacterium]